MREGGGESLVSVEASAPPIRAPEDRTVSMLSTRARSALGGHPSALEAYAEAYRRSGQADLLAAMHAALVQMDADARTVTAAASRLGLTEAVSPGAQHPEATRRRLASV